MSVGGVCMCVHVGRGRWAAMYAVSEPEWDKEGICVAGGNKSSSQRMLDTYRDMEQRRKYFKDAGSKISHCQRRELQI